MCDAADRIRETGLGVGQESSASPMGSASETGPSLAQWSLQAGLDQQVIYTLLFTTISLLKLPNSNIFNELE